MLLLAIGIEKYQRYRRDNPEHIITWTHKPYIRNELGASEYLRLVINLLIISCFSCWRPWRITFCAGYNVVGCSNIYFNFSDCLTDGVCDFAHHWLSFLADCLKKIEMLSEIHQPILDEILKVIGWEWISGGLASGKISFSGKIEKNFPH